jgi:hypothetical protein
MMTTLARFSLLGGLGNTKSINYACALHTPRTEVFNHLAFVLEFADVAVESSRSQWMDRMLQFWFMASTTLTQLGTHLSGMSENCTSH